MEEFRDPFRRIPRMKDVLVMRRTICVRMLTQMNKLEGRQETWLISCELFDPVVVLVNLVVVLGMKMAI